MAITNETKYVSVRRLNRFKQKIQQEFAGPVYDDVDHGFNFPSTAKITYDSTNHGFIFG